MQENKTKDNLIKYRLVVLAFLIIVFGYVAFKAGVNYSCANGIVHKNRCVSLQKVATVSVCEYNPYTCAANCGEFMINDAAAFCANFTEVI